MSGEVLRTKNARCVAKARKTAAARGGRLGRNCYGCGRFGVLTMYGSINLSSRVVSILPPERARSFCGALSSSAG